jgi:polysaccharide biosynthesis/export protein
MRSVAALALVLSSGCALAPGMQMDERAAVERGLHHGGPYKVELISAGLVAQLVAQSREQLEPDPHGDAPAPAYTVAPNDVLQVIVWGHPELTAPTGPFRSPEENGNPVLPDGTMYYPYVGSVQVAGKTVQEIRSVLAERLVRVVPNVQLEVRVAAFRGKTVPVTGEVVAPSALPLGDLPLRVHDAIVYAKGITPEADLSNVTLTRKGTPHRLDLLAFSERGDLSQNWLLRDGDVVNVGNRNVNRVFVMGEVKRQQAKQMVNRRMTLAEAIGGADGFDPFAANVARIYVLRGNFDAPQIFRLDASSADALLLATEFPLRPKDVVYVATYELTRWNRVISQILPTIETLYDAAVAVDIATRP